MRTLAVLDLETTGKNPYRHDRVVEVGVVRLIAGKGITAEMATLVNPERDIGPTSIHGITASDVVNAPRFGDIAGRVADFLKGADTLVGHNVRFDISFLRLEYRRMGVEMPQYVVCDTMVLAGGGTLSACCAEYGVKFSGRAHSALHDARAVASLLETMIVDEPSLLAHLAPAVPPSWPFIPPATCQLYPREKLHVEPAQVPSYIQRLAERLSVGSLSEAHSEGERDYRALLWHALEDGHLDESECDALVEVATHWGLTVNKVEAIHREYISRLAKAAWVDRQITDAERREIQSAAQLLGFGRLSDGQFNDLLRSCETAPHTDVATVLGDDLRGEAVCFTGESCCCIDGELISREMAETLVAEKGLRVMSSVTKSLGILVVADPNTQSSKAEKARRYGVRIIHEPVFWRMIGVPVA